MPQEYTVRVEGVICIFDREDLVAVIRKNGEMVVYKTERLGFDDLRYLLESMSGQKITP